MRWWWKCWRSCLGSRSASWRSTSRPAQPSETCPTSPIVCEAYALGVLSLRQNCVKSAMDERTAHDSAPLLALLDHLSSSAAGVDDEWREWRIARVAGAGNNLIFRATSAAYDLAIKF